jgi:LytS/YehU family sensor histidine kinase
MINVAPNGSNTQDRASPQVPRRIALASIAGFWLFYFLLNTLRAALENEQGQLDMIGRRTVVTLASTVLTGLLYLVLRRVEHKSTATLITTAFLAAIPVSIGYGALNYTAFYLVNPSDTVRQEMHPQHAKQGHVAAAADYAASWYFFIASWAVLYVALSYAYKMRNAERNAALYRAEAQSAQLRALRYQINPHFLFNTLNSLSTLVLRQRNDEAEQMIMNLAKFFRTSLTADPTEDVPLAEEIRMQRLYLDIEQVRFPGRLSVTVDIPPALNEAPVPAMLLQPIVENAIKYAVAPSAPPVALTIRARADNGRLLVTIENDGDSVAVTPGGHGVGLRNVCDRLHARFPGQADCQFGPMPEGGFRVALTMPLMAMPLQPVALIGDAANWR